VDILGIILLIVGAILYYSSRAMMKNKKSFKDNTLGVDNEYFALIKKSSLIVRNIGAVLVVIGSIIIIFI